MSDSIYRLRRASAVLRRGGVRGVLQRGLRGAASRLDLTELEIPGPTDIADSSDLRYPVAKQPVRPGKPLVVAWVTTPPSLGSGGHTTMFRMVEALEAAGHECRLMLYDRFGDVVARHEQVIRQGWPWVKAAVSDVAAGFAGVDVAVATSWQTAHVLATRSQSPMKYCYLVQDFEPYFYPHGALYALAEDTYRFGFHHLTIGSMLPGLVDGYGSNPAEPVDFGCDTAVYRLTNTGPRRGVVFYAKPEVPRRGFVLGRLALEQFHRRHPDQPIHLFGSVPAKLPFAAERHGSLTPEKLNELYNQCLAGLALSFTNVSLTPEEMLAAGVIPVLNELPITRSVLDNPHLRWVHPSPSALADALGAIVSDPQAQAHAKIAAASVVGKTWADAQLSFRAAIERIAYGS